MLRYILGVSLITVVIMIIRALTDGKMLRKHQYALWLLIPIYMIVSPFIKIGIPVSMPVPVIEEVVITEEQSNSNMVVSGGEGQVRPIENPGVKVINSETKADNSNRKPIDLNMLLKNIFYSVSISALATLVIYNAGFVLYCRHKRRYIDKDPISGLKIYDIRHRGTPFLLINKIYVDEEMEGLNEYIICHEACHYKHGDFWWIILRYLILALNWYNPFIWAAFILSGRDCELACDEEVIRMLGEGNSQEYATALLEIVDQRSKASFRFTVSTGMRGEYKTMKKRLLAIKHPAKKSYKALVLSLATILIFSGCATMNPTTAGSAAESSKETQNVQPETSDAETSGEKAISFTDNNTHIEKSIEYNGATLSINADIESIADKDLKKAKLTYDKDLLDKLNNEWVAQNYPDASKRPQVTCDLNDGIIDFTDYDKDINTWDGDSGEVIMKKGFVTDKTPLGMSTDATSAGNDAIGFIQAYSPFEYRIFNILAANDTQNNKGYYDVNLQAEYNGLPVALVKGVMRRDDVSDEAEAGHLCSIGFNIKVSKDGIFGFQGKSAMKTVDIKPVTNVVPFDNIADKCLEDMKIDIPADGNYGPGITVTDQKFEIVKVSVEYIPKNATFGDVELIPAWCCECVNSCISNGQLQTVTYYLAYSVETGELLVQYY